MNANLHRIVWNAARQMRMVVQETARSAGKAPGTTTGAVAIVAAVVLALDPAQAQIVADPGAPGHRATILATPNGIPLVNIVAPNAAGVSHNIYRQFDVGANGAVINNARSAVRSNIGGIVGANPWLAKGPARIILNEVNSSAPSYLRGPMEVAGSKAELIIANPSGIQVQGGGFINVSRATLTTGVPQLNAFGGIDRYRVTAGTIGVSGTGLDASGTEFAALYARMVSINGGVWGGGELRVVTGANEVGADAAPGVPAKATPLAGTGPTPPLAFDAGALGGMYAQKIWIMGTEAGVGARNAGSIQTGAGDARLMGLGELTVADFLHDQTLELEDVYRASTGSGRSGWTSLRRDAGLIAEEPGPQEDYFSRRFGDLLHVDDPRRLDVMSALGGAIGLAESLDQSSNLVKQMFAYQIDGRHDQADDHEAFSDRLELNPAVRSELVELSDLLQARTNLLHHPVPGLEDTPLCLHAAYGVREILTAVGWLTSTRRAPFQAGVLPLANRKTELLFVTLDKSEGYHDRISYHDYAISTDRFHWQTQNSAGQDTPGGRRYLESSSNGWQFQLFVRPRKGEAYRACGRTTLESAEGDRPMSIVWKLETPLSAHLFREFSVLRGA